MRVSEPDVRRWTGASALAVAASLAVEVTAKLTIGVRPELDQEAALVDYVVASHTAIIIVVLADAVLMASLIVFLSCFRELVCASRPGLRWVADIAHGAGLVFVAVTLVGDGLDAGTALDVTGLDPDPSAIRAMIEGHALMFGSIGAVLLALVSAASAYLILLTGALPRWTGVLAAVAAGSNLVWTFSAFGGTSPTSFTAAGGWGNAVTAVFPWLVWVICVGIAAVRGERHHERRSREADAPGSP